MNHETALAQNGEILRGGPCPTCGRDWVPDPEVPEDARSLTHADDCELDLHLERLALFDFLRDTLYQVAHGLVVLPDRLEFIVNDRHVVQLTEVAPR